MRVNCSDTKPSTVTEDDWLHAFPAISAQAPTERAGKWLVFLGKGYVDEVWSKIRDATVAGTLGLESKVSTNRPGPFSQKGGFVVCVYTYDGADVDDVRRVRDELRGLGIEREIGWKADASTVAGEYAIRGDQEISSYRG